ncbi:MAG: 16S rRNA (guanine1516-N2)-methyltransferase [Gammaproteobacteria bacterium]|jgi:16S rRNA (guanine1516-N2)-methyltransferase
MGMRDPNTAMDDQSEQDNHAGIVILVEDSDRISPLEDAKKLSVETGFPIVKRGGQYANEKSNSRSSKNKTANKKAPKIAKHSVKGGNISSNAKELSEWQLVYTSQGLALRLSNEPSWGDIIVDFNSPSLNYRKLHGGGRNEALAKAIGIKGKDTLSVIDCTAGMGNDSFIMASVGAHVTMLERSPIIGALLEDALNRIEVIPEFWGRMLLVKTDATDYILKQGTNKNAKPLADVIYLDPMFPHKKKSALVKKEMRAFQQLLGADVDSAQLLEAALNHAGSRVVVKRPSFAESIELASGRKPDTAIESKKHRFDVYIQH